MPDLPHFRMPFSPAGSSFAAIEQNSAEEIEQCVEAACKTLAGSRIDAVGYGVPDQAFSTQTPTVTPVAVVTAVDAAEPRAQLLGEAHVEGMVRRIVLRTGVAA